MLGYFCRIAACNAWVSWNGDLAVMIAHEPLGPPRQPAGRQTCLGASLCTASAPVYVYTLLPCAVGHLLVLTSDARGC